MAGVGANFFKATLAQSLASGGSETTIYLDRITTLVPDNITGVGETITTADFATFGKGTITIDPLNPNNLENVSFTAVDSTNIALTGAVRGLSAIDYTASTSRAKYHPVGTTVIIAFGVHNLTDLVNYIATTLAGGTGTGTDTTSGTTKISENLGSLPRAMAALVSQQSSPGLTLKVNPFSAYSALTSTVIQFAGGNTASMAAAVSNPRIDLVVYNVTSAAVAVRTGTEGASPSVPVATYDDIVLCSVYIRVGTTQILERDDSVSTHGYVKEWFAVSSFNPTPPGIISPFAGRSTPTGWLLCDGSAVSRTTYANLFNILSPSQAVTFTNSSSAVTMTAHALVVGDQVHFTTTGTLPTNFTTAVTYYVKTVSDANTVILALSPGGTTITAGSAGSGTHTVYKSGWGMGDGSTTFTLPDFRSRVPVGLAAAAPTTQKLAFEPAQVSAGSDNVTIPNIVFPSQGQKVQLTSSGTLPAGLSLATDYWIVRSSSTTIQFATTQANANASTPVVVNITDQGSGVHTMTFTGLAHTVLGRMGGEETHGIANPELASHFHTWGNASNATGTGFANSGSNQSGTNVTSTVGSDAQHNIMQPFVVVNYVIKY